ncbi:MAG: hypothetical protein NVV79_20865 [Devosia ginsengisoli]|nr:hypothetical protein [Devosia ginsengisoli]MCR6673710.1 hypothetical protein [Devosia ginsengisoli]
MPALGIQQQLGHGLKGQVEADAGPDRAGDDAKHAEDGAHHVEERCVQRIDPARREEPQGDAPASEQDRLHGHRRPKRQDLAEIGLDIAAEGQFLGQGFEQEDQHDQQRHEGEDFAPWRQRCNRYQPEGQARCYPDGKGQEPGHGADGEGAQGRQFEREAEARHRFPVEIAARQHDQWHGQCRRQQRHDDVAIHGIVGAEQRGRDGGLRMEDGEQGKPEDGDAHGGGADQAGPPSVR